MVDNLCITINMKKFLVCLLSITCIFIFIGCKKKDDILSLSKNLTEYKIEMNLNTENKTADVKQKIDYINSTNSILKNLKLHLYVQNFREGATESVISSTKLNTAYPNGMSYSKFEINRLRIENQDTTIVYENDYDSILSIDLINSLMPDERILIELEYSFTIPNCYHRFGFGDNTINLANFYPIMCVYENGAFNTNGYNANGDPFYSEMANYCVDIITDNQYVVAGTGEKKTINFENNLIKTSFKANLVRDFAMVVSNKFEVISKTSENTKVEYYYFNDEQAETNLNTGIDAIKTFSKLFGSYPYSTFSIVKTDFGHGGMEYPNLIMISSSIENEDDYKNVIIHETAHQWWYAMVGNDEFTYPWLDEGLTEFSTLLFYDNNEGYNLNHKDMIDASKSNYTLFITVYEDVLGKIDTSMRAVDQYPTEPEYTYCTYVKGVLMFESLYQLVGKDKFIKSLKEYFATNKYTNTTPDKLISSFETICKQNLNSFFDSWTTGKVVIR